MAPKRTSRSKVKTGTDSSVLLNTPPLRLGTRPPNIKSNIQSAPGSNLSSPIRLICLGLDDVRFAGNLARCGPPTAGLHVWGAANGRKKQGTWTELIYFGVRREFGGGGGRSFCTGSGNPSRSGRSKKSKNMVDSARVKPLSLNERCHKGVRHSHVQVGYDNHTQRAMTARRHP
jgi:hypothetical protein